MKLSLFHDDTKTELDAAISYYEQKTIGLGLRFHAEVQQAIEILERHPKIGSPYKDTSLRRYVLGEIPIPDFLSRLARSNLDCRDCA